jgi:fructose-1,6-bisphosphatase II / sedoheptulose-1,7-bisphosphatase
VDRTLVQEILEVVEQAAIASAQLTGLGQKDEADAAAVEAMRKRMGTIQMQGRIVIGEGERDEAPMLYIGELVGSGNGPSVDIALDPLEGTNLTAKDMPNALTVIAMGPKDSLLNAPDVYMEKLAYGSRYKKDIITIEMSPSQRIETLAKAKGCNPKDLMVCVLERPRHQTLIEEIRATGARLRLITDGDVAGVIHCANTERTGIDIYMGIGGAPEGVLAAAALKCLGGYIQGKLIFRNDLEKNRAIKTGIKDFDKIYSLDDMVTKDVIFAATGVTDGSILRGAKWDGNILETETILMRSKTGSIRRLLYQQKFS